MPWYHLTLSTEGRCTAIATEPDRLAAIRTIARVAGDEALLHSIVDEHAHLVASCTARKAGYLGRAVRAALSHLTGTDWGPADVRPVSDRDHLEHLVGYCCWQPVKHRISDAPALWSGSCFQDLLGARILQGFDAGAIFRELPRFGLERQFAAAGIRDRVRPLPVDDRSVRAAGAVRLVEAGASAVGWTDLSGESRPQMAARRAVVALGAAVGLPRSETAFALGCARVTVRRLADGPPDERLIRAIRLQLALPGVALRVGLGSPMPKTPWLPPFDERWDEAFVRTRGPCGIDVRGHLEMGREVDPSGDRRGGPSPDEARG